MVQMFMITDMDKTWNKERKRADKSTLIQYLPLSIEYDVMKGKMQVA